MLKGSKLYSIFRMKCPVCHQGDFFVSHPYDLRQTGKIHPCCPHCKAPFQKETGFYFGAMYVSYAIGVALFVACYVIMNLLFPEAGVTTVFLTVLGTLTVLAPLIYSMSKIIWANIFMHYQTPKEDSDKKKLH